MSRLSGRSWQYYRKTAAQEHTPCLACGFDSLPASPAASLVLPRGGTRVQWGEQGGLQRSEGEEAEADKDGWEAVDEGPSVPGSRV